MAVTAIPTLDAIAQEPALVRGLPRSVVVDLTLKAQSVVNSLMVLLAETPAGPPLSRNGGGDRLLVADEAAIRLGHSKKWLLTHADGLPFTVRIEGQRVRFSEQGIEHWIALMQKGAV